MSVAVTHGRSDTSAATRRALARRARPNDRLGPPASRPRLEWPNADDAAALDIDPNPACGKPPSGARNWHVDLVVPRRRHRITTSQSHERKRN